MSAFSVVFITTPAGLKGEKIAQELVKRRLAACVNVVPTVKSIYWWKRKIESGKESLLIVKTRSSLVKRLIRHVTSIHPYTVPEVISLSIKKGHRPYLDWIKSETKA